MKTHKLKRFFRKIVLPVLAAYVAVILYALWLTKWPHSNPTVTDLLLTVIGMAVIPGLFWVKLRPTYKKLLLYEIYLCSPILLSLLVYYILAIYMDGVHHFITNGDNFIPLNILLILYVFQYVVLITMRAVYNYFNKPKPAQ